MEGQDMTDYSELVKALRHCSHDGLVKCNECKYGGKGWPVGCEDEMMADAAAAIEALQDNIKRLKEANDELREAQTYIDKWGTRWGTSAKDVPDSAYKHGYADGKYEALTLEECIDRLHELGWLQEHDRILSQPKRGKWKPFDLTYGRSIYSCSVCEQATEVPMCMEKPMYAYCPNCGADMRKMEVQK